MGYLSDDRMRAITCGLCQRLASLDHHTRHILFDTTNFSTEMQPYDDLERRLARKGNAKDKRYGNNIVGVAVAVTDEGIPLPLGVYPGNWNDHQVIDWLIDDIVQRVEEIGSKPQQIALVIDKGCLSQDLVKKIRGKMHLVGSLKRGDCPKLIKIPLSRYTKLYTTGKDNDVLGYRATKKTLGRVFTVVVSYNPESQQKQQREYENAKQRFLTEAKKIQTSLVPGRRGRKPTQESIRNRLMDVIPKKWRTVFKFHVGTTLEKHLDFKAWVVKECEDEFKEGFGKTVVFTDDPTMTSEDLVKTYMSLWMVEEDFKFLKNRLLIPVTPINHRLDLPIKVHVFLCVIGLLFYRYMLRKLKDEEDLSLPQLVHALEDIRVGVLVAKDTLKVRHVVEEMDAVEARLFNCLKMARFVHK